MDWKTDKKLKKEIVELVDKLGLNYISRKRIFCFKSIGSKSRARARIWSLPRIWQKALKCEPAYVIETLCENFDNLSGEEKTKVLIHELLHIPKTFSGSLLPHRTRYKRIDAKRVNKYFKKLSSRN